MTYATAQPAAASLCPATFVALGRPYRGTAERFVELSRTADRFPAPAAAPMQIEVDRGRLRPAAWSSSTSRRWVDS